MRADLRVRADARAPAQNGKRMDDRVGLQLDVGVDPRRRRIDDADAGIHVRAENPVAEVRRSGGELGSRVDPVDLLGVRGGVHGRRAAALDDVPDRVGQIELALRVAGIEPVERSPELLGARTRRSRS